MSHLAGTINPLMPAGYDVLWSVITLAHVVLLFFALRAWFRTSPATLLGVVQAVVIVFVPVLGSVAYLAARPEQQDRRSDSTPSRPARAS